MPSLSIAVSVGGLGENISQTVTRTADGGDVRAPTVPHGYAGTLTTHTSSTQGTATLGDGHGITTGMRVDVYWSGGRRLGMTVGTVSGDSVPLTSSGTGDNLPIATTALVVSKAIQINMDIDVDNLSVLSLMSRRVAFNTTEMSHVQFQNADDEVLADIDLEERGPYLRDLNGSDLSPFTGTGPASKAFASNGSPSSDATLQMIWLQDSTP